MKKLKFVFAVLLLALVPGEISFADSAAAASTPKGFSIDADAVALFDRAAKLYGDCKTIRMRWIKKLESSSPNNTEKPTITTFAFVRPAQSRAEVKNGLLPHQIYLVDGKFSWSLQTVNPTLTTYLKQPLDKDSTPLENAVFSLMLFTETPFFDWLQGKHDLQPSQIKLWKKPDSQMEYLTAKKLAPAKWKDRSWERVQIRQQFGPDEVVSFDNIYWLASDNARLVRIQELDESGEVFVTHEIVEQTFNPAIPASTFALKIPRGAKQE